jgi:hypothetical protein
MPTAAVGRRSRISLLFTTGCALLLRPAPGAAPSPPSPHRPQRLRYVCVLNQAVALPLAPAPQFTRAIGHSAWLVFSL